VDPDRWRAVAPEIKSLFGRPLRVLLATWFISRGMQATYLQEAQAAMLSFGEAPSGVSTELRVLVAKGLLSETPDGRRVYFCPLPAPLWSVYEAIDQAYGIWSDSASTSPPPTT